MLTNRVTFAGGLSGHAIQVPVLPGSPSGTRGNEAGSGGGGFGYNPNPVTYIDYGQHMTQFYAGFVPEVAKANYIAPSSQGARLRGIYDSGMFPESGVNTPSRSQKGEAYTEALQQFAASNTWQTAGPTDSPGTRAKQPSLKFVSPFSTLPIQTRMPWDL